MTYKNNEKYYSEVYGFINKIIKSEDDEEKIKNYIENKIREIINRILYGE